MTTVKICGLQDAETIRSIRHLPIDYIGFVFARSKRQVTASQAKEMIAALHADTVGRPSPQTAGIFLDPTFDEVRRVLAQAQLDIVQLHGGESPEFCRELKRAFGVRLFKTIAVDPEVRHNREAVFLRLEPYAEVVDAVLLDTHDPVAGGGTGRSFAWECIPPYREWTRRHGLPLLVAGGLTTDNVRELIASYRPDGVDVSSGVETDGRKDIRKIATFVERVKS